MSPSASCDETHPEPASDELYCSKCLPRRPSDVLRTPLDLLTDPSVCVKICAPMVRYSKLPFRLLVRKYGCDIAFSPMVVADSFSRSEKARDAEFSTSLDDRPLIVQFGAANAVEFVEAAKFVVGVCDGVDLNCGCPQRWVCKKGFGSCLINKPELVSDMVKHVRRLPMDNSADFTVSIKIRIHDDLKKTVNLVQTAERAGVSFISVHGRTVVQRKEPPNLEAIALVKDSVSVPVIANGGLKNLADVHRVHEATGVDGVMAAEGLLENPAMFLPNCDQTPPECVKDYIDNFSLHGSRFTTFHHHLMSMLQRWHQKPLRKVFNALTAYSDVTDFLKTNHACFSDVTFPEFGEDVDELELIG